MTLSYARGPSDVPLLGETIGANLRKIVERFPDHEALVVGHQAYARPTPSCGARLIGRHVPCWQAGCASAIASESGRRTATSGWCRNWRPRASARSS